MKNLIKKLAKFIADRNPTMGGKLEVLLIGALYVGSGVFCLVCHPLIYWVWFLVLPIVLICIFLPDVSRRAE
jgi:hypothetical protein